MDLCVSNTQETRSNPEESPEKSSDVPESEYTSITESAQETYTGHDEVNSFRATQSKHYNFYSLVTSEEVTKQAERPDVGPACNPKRYGWCD